MGRNRKKSNQKLPKYVYVNRGRLIYRPPGCKDIVMGSDNMSLPDVWDHYKQLTSSSQDTLQYIVAEYLKSNSHAKKQSKRQIEQGLERLLSTPVGKLEFKQVKIKNITPGVIRKYLDYRGNISANREIAYLSSAWAWCYERDKVRTTNPCKGVRRITEKARTRYVTDEEYQAVYSNAAPMVKVAMELAYLCRMRISEVLDTRVKDIEDKGLNTRRLKGSDSALTLSSPRLDEAIEQGLKGCIRVPEMPIVNRKGSDVRYDAFHKLFIKASRGFDFTFHDIKAKGVSDFDGDKKAASGHKSESMVRVYDRKRKSVKATK